MGHGSYFSNGVIAGNVCFCGVNLAHTSPPIRSRASGRYDARRRSPSVECDSLATPSNRPASAIANRVHNTPYSGVCQDTETMGAKDKIIFRIFLSFRLSWAIPLPPNNFIRDR